LVLKNINETRSLFLLIFFIKIFWYARFNFNKNKKEGLVNDDNDSWEGVLFLELALKSKLVEKKEGSFIFNMENFCQFETHLDNIIHQFDDKFLDMDESRQNEVIHRVMTNNVPFKNGQFFLSEKSNEVLFLCENILEYC
jgi:hypothetical protein